MTDDGVGRLLVVSLHQAIGDVLPQRLEYYEHWLSPMGLKEGRGGLAPLLAVLSFLRQEGEPAYAQVMALAGQYSAEWHAADAGVGRGVVGWLPRRLRARMALGRSRTLLRAAFASHEVKVSMRRGVATVAISRSVFCTLRERWAWPTCAYFAGAVRRDLAMQGLDVEVRTTDCVACGGDQCRLEVRFPWAPPLQAGEA